MRYPLSVNLTSAPDCLRQVSGPPTSRPGDRSRHSLFKHYPTVGVLYSSARSAIRKRAIGCSRVKSSQLLGKLMLPATAVT